MAEQKKETAPPATETVSSSSASNDTTVKSQKSSGNGRTRVFAKLVYPTKEQYEAWYQEHYVDTETGEATPHYEGEDGYGQAPDDWQRILDECHVSALVSPLHALDRNPDGKLKKPHYHVMLMFDGVKTQKQADEIFNQIGGVGKEEINSTRGYARYLTHMDNPEKYQYKEKPLCLGGVDYDAVIHLPTDDINTLKDMLQYVRKNYITSFAQFMDICMSSNEDWFSSLATRNAYVVKEYIKSLQWELQHSTEDER